MEEIKKHGRKGGGSISSGRIRCNENSTQRTLYATHQLYSADDRQENGRAHHKIIIRKAERCSFDCLKWKVMQITAAQIRNAFGWLAAVDSVGQKAYILNHQVEVIGPWDWNKGRSKGFYMWRSRQHKMLTWLNQGCRKLNSRISRTRSTKLNPA